MPKPCRPEHARRMWSFASALGPQAAKQLAITITITDIVTTQYRFWRLQVMFIWICTAIITRRRVGIIRYSEYQYYYWYCCLYSWEEQYSNISAYTLLSVLPLFHCDDNYCNIYCNCYTWSSYYNQHYSYHFWTRSNSHINKNSVVIIAEWGWGLGIGVSLTRNSLQRALENHAAGHRSSDMWAQLKSFYIALKIAKKFRRLTQGCRTIAWAKPVLSPDGVHNMAK